MNSLDNECLSAYLTQCGLEGIRTDIPFEDSATERLWNEARQAERVATEVMGALMQHLKILPPKPGHYCGCCEAWHDW